VPEAFDPNSTEHAALAGLVVSSAAGESSGVHELGFPAQSRASGLERALRLFELAEASFVWCSDCMSTRQLQAVLDLYAESKWHALQHSSHELAGGPPTAQTTPQLTVSEQRTRALQLRHEVAQLLAVGRRQSGSGTHRPRSKLLMLALASAGVVVAVMLGLAARDRIQDDFDVGNVSQGAQWLASSAYASVPARGTLDSAATAAFFFHTQDETGPWLEIDLGRELPVRRAIVANRDNCCGTRALPLIIETSRDRTRWTQVAERTKPFEIWRVNFAADPVRWVRLRVPRHTAFHLKSITLRT
jgi:hypothetical protein